MSIKSLAQSRPWTNVNSLLFLLQVAIVSLLWGSFLFLILWNILLKTVICTGVQINAVFRQ